MELLELGWSGNSCWGNAILTFTFDEIVDLVGGGGGDRVQYLVVHLKGTGEKATFCRSSLALGETLSATRGGTS